MRQRITIEIEADENTLDEARRKIEAVSHGLFAAYADEMREFCINKEILPEKVPGELQVPSFLMQRPYDCRRKDCKDRIYAKGAGV